MKLRATHIDGFTEQLLRWTLEAQSGAAIVEASWRGRNGHEEKIFEMVFPDSRIREISEALADLRSFYDGGVDDFPQFSMSTEIGSINRHVIVRAGVKWPPEDERFVDRFMQVWRPLSRDVESLIKIPGRERTCN